MSDEEISALLGDDPADLVICGGSHVPFDRTVTGVRVINVGSVGEAPSATSHLSAGAAYRPTGPGAGSLHADATLIETRRGEQGFEVIVEQFVVPLGRAA